MRTAPHPPIADFLRTNEGGGGRMEEQKQEGGSRDNFTRLRILVTIMLPVQVPKR